MFSELLESVGIKKQTRRGRAFMASAMAQSLCLMAAFLIPLIYTQALPKMIPSGPFLTLFTVLTPASPPRETAPRQPGRLIADNVLNEPNFIPPNIGMIQEPPLPADASTDSQTDGLSSFSLLENIATSPAVPTPQPPPTPPTPPLPAPIAPQRIKQGGIVQAAKLIYQPQPLYPILARQTGIQGTVVLHAVVDDGGNVSELQVISGHPLLVQAALYAVKQWRYQPTLLNGEPVEVDTTITVSFVLGG
jgi:protein TonB